MLRKVLVACLSFFVIAVFALRAQDVFVMPGAASGGQAIAAFAANPLSEITSVPTGAGAFLTLTADGKFYIISNSTSMTVSDSSFASPHSVGSFSQAASGAAVTPDGSKVAIAAGVLHVFTTSTDTELGSTSGISVGSGVNVMYVAAGLDGAALFTVGPSTAGGSQVNAISLPNLTTTGTLAISGTATSITVGPNGLIYVGTASPNQLIEINPGTLTVTSGGLISLGGPPTVPVFTPDGQYLLVIGQNAALYSFQLSNHALASSVSLSSVAIPLNFLQITGKNTVAAFASQAGNLYQITIGLSGILSIGPFPVLSNGISAIAVSNEVPAGNITTKAGLYAASAGTLYRLDLPTNTTTQGAVPTSIAGGALSYTAPVASGSPSQLLVYGNNQTVASGGTTLPLVVQALDGSGHPLSGVSVTFAANSSSASVSPAAAATGANGYALTYLTAPTATGTVQVTATAGAQTALFTVTVGSSTTGAAAGLSIVAGQGQLLPENANTANSATGGAGSSLVTLVTDSGGNPVAGATVTYTITSGSGILTGGLTSATVTTGSNGKASIDYQAPNLGQQISATGGFYPTTVQATSGANTVNFYITTIPGPGNPIADPTPTLVTPVPGTTLTAQAGQAVPQPNGLIGVRIASSLGVGIPNVSISLNNGGLSTAQFPSATCSSPASVLSDTSGAVTCAVVAGPAIGTEPINVVVGYFTTFSNAFTLTVTPGPPGKITIVQGNNQSGAPGQLLPLALKVQVSDASGNVLAGTPVTWQVVTAGTATLSGVSSATDTNGFASALATLGNVAGPATVTVTAGTVTATFTITVNIAAAGLQKVSGDAQTTLISTQFGSPLVVQVVDSKGNPVAGATVNFSVTTGSATLGSPTASTGSNGQASTTVTAGSSAGAITVTASTSGGFSVSFSLTSHLPGPTSITIVNGASFLPGSANSPPPISPGGIATIIGTGIAPSVQGLVVANEIVGSLPTTLAGVTITFNGTAAPIYYVLNSNGQQQVTVQVPFEVTPGAAVSVVISSAAGGSATVTTPVAPYAPGAFTTTFSGQTIAVAQRPDGSFVSPTNTALQGEDITFYVTGLGQTSPATVTGDGGILGQHVTAPLIVGINNAGVPLISATYAPGLVGVYAVTVQIPIGTTGNNVPFGLIATDAQGNQYWMQAVFIPIR